MIQSLDGMLERCGQLCKRADKTHGPAYAHCLTVLLDNLREVRDRWRKGKADEVLQNFFDVYDLSESEPTDANP